MLNELWRNIVESGMLATLIGAAASLVVAVFRLGFAWVRAQTGKIQNDRVRDALTLIEGAAETAVMQVAQEEGDALKEAAEDGKLTAEEAASLKQLALNKFHTFVTEDIVALAREQVPDVEAWVSALIEKYARYK